MELFAGDRRLGRISHRKNERNNGDNQVDIRLPHLGDDPWRIEISGQSPQWVPFDAWIEQSERGLSYFEGEIDSKCTLGSISCGNGSLTVGAFDTFEMAALAPPYEATSAGPTRKSEKTSARTGLRRKPELSAPGLNIVAARSQGGVTALSGTSMAAPHVAGVIALLFQLAHLSGRGPLDFADTCKILSNGAQALTAIGLQDPEEPSHDLRLGYGKINGPSAVTALLKLIPTAIRLDLKLLPTKVARPELADFQQLFEFLRSSVVNGQNGMQKKEILGYLNDQIRKNDSFRLTIESLH